MSDGTVISHVKVLKEIEKHDDELKRWCKKHKHIFQDEDECQVKELDKVSKCYDPKYYQNESNRTSEWADPWLIALSLCRGKATIVTDEKSNKNLKNPSKIPEIASILGIKCINLMEFLEKIGVGKAKS